MKPLHSGQLLQYLLQCPRRSRRRPLVCRSVWRRSRGQDVPAAV